jgi:AcrR family transcriptional regulator
MGDEGDLTKGQRTRARILAAAEEIFGRHGYHDASISEITKLAGVAQGSFYVHFSSKRAIFEELIRTRGEEMRAELRAASRGLRVRAEIERAGFRAFFAWIAQHRWLYRVVRLAEFVDPALREHWYRTFADQYIDALARTMKNGETQPVDPEVLAWAVMGMADFVAMRFIVWDEGVLSEAQLTAFCEIALRAICGAAGAAR